MKKNLIISAFLLLVVLMCSACQNPFVYFREPCGQPETEWMSSDGSIVFSVDSTGTATGQMVVDGKTVDFYLSTDMGSGMHLYAPEVMETNLETQENEYEYWLCSYYSKNRFSAIVKETTYFETGEVLIFNKVNS